MSAIPNPAQVTRWLRTIPGWHEATSTAVVPLDGGASNITCRLDISGAERSHAVLRVQRERGIFEPYDVVREGEVLRLLQGSGVPAPALLASEPGTGFLGAPFILMEWVDAPHMGVAGPEASFPAFTAMVANIHALDWQALGMGFLGVPASPKQALGGELDAIAIRSRRFVEGREPLLARAEVALLKGIPADGPLTLCQGDINVFNYLFRAGKVVAVVDWEQARISDPRSDVGQLVSLSHLKGAPFGPAGEAPFVQAYQAASGLELPGMAWFRARWLWELGVIYFGWKAFNGSDPWYTWEDLATLLASALDEI